MRAGGWGMEWESAGPWDTLPLQQEARVEQTCYADVVNSEAAGATIHCATHSPLA